MNPDTKQFEAVTDPVPEEKRNWPVFKVGQKVVIGGVPFSIRKITKKDLVLRPER